MTEVRVGGVRIIREDAIEWAEDYLTRRNRTWSYPAYDGYRGGGPDEISDADLLAPALLNVNRISLRAYYWLQSVAPVLEETLRLIPVDLCLDCEDLDALEANFSHLERLFAVLDEYAPQDVRGTILAKILHRKRPGFIPLYDANISYCYQAVIGAPVPVDPKRKWGAFAVFLARAVREDLRRQPEVWDEIVLMAPGPEVSRLRALDIVAWRAGRRGVRS